jgi:hypothetical protein
MSSNRRDFIRKVAAGSAGLAIGGSAMGMSARSYSRIIGANDRLNVAIAGLGRRLGAFYEPIALKEANVELVYLCDVMAKQRERGLQNFAKHISYKPKLKTTSGKLLTTNKSMCLSMQHPTTGIHLVR